MFALYKGLLLTLWAGCVWSAEVRIITDPALIPLVTWGLVLASALVGFFASSSERIFGWVIAREAGKITQCFFGSMAAGLIAYAGAVSSSTPMPWPYIAVLVASYLGDTYIKKYIGGKPQDKPGDDPK